MMPNIDIFLKNQEITSARTCRACLNNNYKKNVRLEDGNSWTKYFEFCLGLDVNSNDMPFILCIKCATTLKQFSKFKKKCERSFYLWKSLIERTQTNTDNVFFETSIKNEIIPDIDSETNINKAEIFSDDWDYSKNHVNTEISCIIENKMLIHEQPLDKTCTYLLPKNKIKLIEPDKINQNQVSKLTCSTCCKEFVSEKWFQKHKVHNCSKATGKEKKVTMYFCGICEYSASEKQTVLSHVNQHYSSNDLECKLCDYRGRDWADMAGHRMHHCPKGMLAACHLCDKFIKSEYCMQFHFRSLHLGKPGGWCSKCSKEFSKFITWKQHERLHVINRFICEHCGKKFLFKNQIAEHMRDHMNIRNFVCDQCGNTFKRLFNLKQHKRFSHSQSEPVKCSHCNRIYKNQETYKEHLKMLERDKPYQCDVCSKQYPTRSSLKVHMVWHNDERPHCCKICGSGYKAKAQLTVHMRSHTGDMPYKCEECNKAFATTKQLKVHSSVHTGVRRHKCNYCNRSFHGKKLLTDHCIKKHSSHIEIQNPLEVAIT